MSTTIEKAEEKLKQLNEACSLMEDLSWRVDWALDFSKFESINEILYPLSSQMCDILSELEDERDALIEQIEEYKTDKAINEEEFDSSSNLQYCIS